MFVAMGPASPVVELQQPPPPPELTLQQEETGGTLGDTWGGTWGQGTWEGAGSANGFTGRISQLEGSGAESHTVSQTHRRT